MACPRSRRPAERVAVDVLGVVLLLFALVGLLEVPAARADIYRLESPWAFESGAERWTPGRTVRYDLYAIGLEVPAGSMLPGCSGFVPSAPTLEVDVVSGDFATVRVESSDDAVLVARGPDGRLYCNDDFFGLNPGLEMEFAKGRWEFWVGGYDRFRTFPFTLVLQ